MENIRIQKLKPNYLLAVLLMLQHTVKVYQNLSFNRGDSTLLNI